MKRRTRMQCKWCQGKRYCFESKRMCALEFQRGKSTRKKVHVRNEGQSWLCMSKSIETVWCSRDNNYWDRTDTAFIFNWVIVWMRGYSEISSCSESSIILVREFLGRVLTGFAESLEFSNYKNSGSPEINDESEESEFPSMLSRTLQQTQPKFQIFFQKILTQNSTLRQLCGITSDWNSGILEKIRKIFKSCIPC